MFVEGNGIYIHQIINEYHIIRIELTIFGSSASILYGHRRSKTLTLAPRAELAVNNDNLC